MASHLPSFDSKLLSSLAPNARVFELSHPMAASMPVYHQHVPYSLALHRRHGDPHPALRADGSSFSNEIIITSGHSGTHIDALGHFSRDGCVHGGVSIGEIESRDGYRSHHAAEIPPIIQNAVIIDVAAALGVDALAPRQEISVDDLKAALRKTNASLRPGDAVLIRTGWARHWNDAELFIGKRGGMPGPGEQAAQWMIDQGATLVGSDTPGYECLPTPGRSVHAMMLVDAGIHIIENLNLEEIAHCGKWSILLIALPLRLVGSTGSPIRPVGIA